MVKSKIFNAIFITVNKIEFTEKGGPQKYPPNLNYADLPQVEVPHACLPVFRLQTSFLFAFKRINNLPVLFHILNSPASGIGFIQCFTQVSYR